VRLEAAQQDDDAAKKARLSSIGGWLTARADALFELTDGVLCTNGAGALAGEAVGGSGRNWKGLYLGGVDQAATGKSSTARAKAVSSRSMSGPAGW
jgi:hypothetical protein